MGGNEAETITIKLADMGFASSALKQADFVRCVVNARTI